jgi:meiotically up-regulated gene 157 (Mug157) protein
MTTSTQTPPASFPEVRVAAGERRFQSEAIEAAIAKFRSSVADAELGWLFENCFPNTLDTTVFFEEEDGRPSTYVITGDIDAMWLRDSTAQVWPYLKFLGQDARLQRLVAGLIRKQAACVVKDPYANAFYSGEQVGHWASDRTEMRPGVHERKWEIDSLCYTIRLAYHYWKITGDTTPFDDEWLSSVRATLATFIEQQRKENPGPYSFQRSTPHATDTLPLSGYGYPVKPVGLICSSFRPSDDATVYPFLIPSNFFAVVSLRQAAEMVEATAQEAVLASELRALADEVEAALRQHAIIEHPQFGRVYAYEVNGFGSFNLMDDANIPSLLSLPYLGALPADDEVYRNTRRLVLSEENPFFFRGVVAEGIGGPHVGMDMVWPMSIVMRALTSQDDAEIQSCMQALKRTHAGTGFMHEAFHKDDAANFTRSWFAWTNTLFGELLWKLHQENPSLLA